MSKNKFCAALFVMAICCFTIGAIELFQYFDFKNNARTTTASLASKDTRPQNTMVVSGEKLYQYPLTYTTDSGASVYVTPYMSASMKDDLIDDNSVEVTYLYNNPNRIIFSADEFSLGIIWFGLGLIFSAVSILAWRLLRIEVASKKGRGV